MQFGWCAQISELVGVRAAGYDFVELRGKEVFALSDAQFDRLEQELKALGLPCVGFNAYCPAEVTIAGPGFDRANTTAYARVLAERGSRLGIRQVGVGSPGSRRLPDGYDRTLAAKQVRSFLTDSAACFAPFHIRVALEALSRCFCNCVNTCQEALELIQPLRESQIGLILDFYNMERQGEDERDLRPLTGSILHTHLSDDAGDPFHRSVPKPERFAVHARRLKRLRDAGYDGSVSVETDLPLDMEEARRTLAFLRSV